MTKEDFLAGENFKVINGSDITYQYKNQAVNYSRFGLSFSVENITDTYCTVQTKIGPVDLYFTKCILVQ